MVRLEELRTLRSPLHREGGIESVGIGCHEGARDHGMGVLRAALTHRGTALRLFMSGVATKEDKSVQRIHILTLTVPFLI